MTDSYAVQPRAVLGKRVRALRRDGVIPGNIYGRGLESVAVQMAFRDARTLLVEHGTNTLVELQVDGESKPRPVVVRSVKREPVSRELQHMDFYQVDLLREIQAAVPVHLIGEAPAVHTYRGVVLQGVDSVEVSALPADMPTAIEISIDGLEELEAQLTVADLQLPEGVTVLADSDLMLVRVAPPRLEVEEEEEELLEGEEALEEGEEGAEGEEGGDGDSEEASD